MYDIATDQEGNSETAFLNRDALKFIHSSQVDNVQYRTDASGSQTVTEIVRRIAVARVFLTHLANLLGQRHTLYEFRYAIIWRF